MGTVGWFLLWLGWSSTTWVRLGQCEIASEGDKSWHLSWQYVVGRSWSSGAKQSDANRWCSATVGCGLWGGGDWTCIALGRESHGVEWSNPALCYKPRWAKQVVVWLILDDIVSYKLVWAKQVVVWPTLGDIVQVQGVVEGWPNIVCMLWWFPEKTRTQRKLEEEISLTYLRQKVC